MIIARTVRQKTGALPRALALALATTLVAGFSRPVPQTVAMAGELPALAGVESLALMSIDSAFPTRGESSIGGAAELLALDRQEVAMATAPLARQETGQALPSEFPVPVTPVRRLGSFVEEAVLEPVLGVVSHRLWVPVSRYSPERARAELRQPVSGLFHGVGFPNIREHETSTRVTFDDASHAPEWASMITWRTSTDDETRREPIADVRCMGLSAQAVARRADRYEQLILDTAVHSGVSVSLVKAIVTKESCFDSNALSRVGAQGLMQLMPATAAWLKVSDPLDPEENLRAGVSYLASLREQFGTLELALAAYNAGPGNVRRYKGVPPFAETQSYVRSVKAHYRRYVAANRLAAR